MRTRHKFIHSYALIILLAALLPGQAAIGAESVAASAQGRVIYVDRDAGGANNGSSWGNAYTDLQAALSASGSGDEIWVSEGVYTPGSSRADTFWLKSGVAIYGGFSGVETACSQRRWSAHLTILSGDIDPPGTNDSFHVVNGSSASVTAVLDGFTISGGRADGPSPHDVGGGMFINSGSPTLRNVFFKGNSATSGGGLYNKDSSPTLINAVFVNNSASDGGGMYNTSSSPTLVNATFSGNGVTKNGSGMANFNNSSPVLVNSILWGNKSPSIHQIYDENSTPNISYSDIQGPPKPGVGNINLNPNFANQANGDLRLQSSSPAIDAGNNEAIPADVSDADGDGNLVEKYPLDGMGNLRFVDNTAVPDKGLGSSPIVDMGAYEYQFPNNAPELSISGDPALSPINEDDTGNSGTLVSSLLASGTGGTIFSDPDPTFKIGIAVIAVDSSHGVWQYSLDGGSSWLDFGPVSQNSAVLLGSGPKDRVRFVPQADYFGLVSQGIAFRGWDGSDGWSSGKRDVNVSVNGGATAYSQQFETASITVNPVNDAPTITLIADQTSKIGHPVGPILFSIGDIDTPLSALSLSGGSSNITLVPVANLVFGGYDGNRTLTVYPAAYTSGVARLKVIVNDGAASVETEFTLTVSGAMIYLPAISLKK